MDMHIVNGQKFNKSYLLSRIIKKQIRYTFNAWRVFLFRLLRTEPIFPTQVTLNVLPIHFPVIPKELGAKFQLELGHQEELDGFAPFTFGMDINHNAIIFFSWVVGHTRKTNKLPSFYFPNHIRMPIPTNPSEFHVMGFIGVDLAELLETAKYAVVVGKDGARTYVFRDDNAIPSIQD